MTRLGARAVTLVAFAAAILIGVEAAARAQQAGGQPEQTLGARSSPTASRLPAFPSAG